MVVMVIMVVIVMEVVVLMMGCGGSCIDSDGNSCSGFGSGPTD